MSRIVAGLLLAFALGACGQTNIQKMPGLFSSSGVTKPEVVVVSNFNFSAETVALDRGFAAQLRRRMGNVSQEEMRRQIASRVGREIVDAMVETLRAAGLQAREGNQESVVADQPTLLVTGTVRRIDEGNRARRAVVGFGLGKTAVVSDVVVTHNFRGTMKEAFVFVAEAGSAPRPGGTAGVARAVAGAATGAAMDKLSPEVEAGARRLGQAAARRIIAFATEQGWVAKPVT